MHSIPKQTSKFPNLKKNKNISPNVFEVKGPSFPEAWKDW